MNKFDIEVTNLGAIQHRELPIHNKNLILFGKNAVGKSTLLHALALALSGNPNPYGLTKKEIKLIPGARGTQKATVECLAFNEDIDFTRTLKIGNDIKVVETGEKRLVLPEVAYIDDTPLSEKTAKLREAGFLKVFPQVQAISRKDIEEEFERMGVQKQFGKAIIDTIFDEDFGGWDVANVLAKDNVKTLKRDWSQIVVDAGSTAKWGEKAMMDWCPNNSLVQQERDRALSVANHRLSELQKKNVDQANRLRLAEDAYEDAVRARRQCTADHEGAVEAREATIKELQSKVSTDDAKELIAERKGKEDEVVRFKRENIQLDKSISELDTKVNSLSEEAESLRKAEEAVNTEAYEAATESYNAKVSKRQAQARMFDSVLRTHDREVLEAGMEVERLRQAIHSTVKVDNLRCPECGTGLLIDDGLLIHADSQAGKDELERRYAQAKERHETLQAMSKADLQLPTIDEEPVAPLAQDYLSDSEDLKRLRDEIIGASTQLRGARVNERENLSAINLLNSEIAELNNKINLAADVDESERQITFQQKEIEDAMTAYDKDMVGLNTRVENTEKALDDVAKGLFDYDKERDYLLECQKMAQLYLDAHKVAKEIESVMLVDKFTSASGYRARHVKEQLKPLFARFAQLAERMDLPNAYIDNDDWTGVANGRSYSLLSTSEKLCFRLALRLAILEVHDVKEKFIFIDELNTMTPSKLKRVLVDSGVLNNVRAITAYATDDLPTWLDGTLWNKVPCH